MAARINFHPLIKTPRFQPQCHSTPPSHSSCSSSSSLSLPYPTGAPLLCRRVNLASHSANSLPCSYPLRFREQMSSTPKIALSRRGFVTVNSLAATEEKSVAGDRMLVFVPPHPLIKHWVSVLRNEQTPSHIFRNALAELGRLLMYEASRDCLPTVTGEIQSPMGVATVEFIDPREPVAVIPILRAGLALSEHASSILPATKTYHLGLSRDEETLLPTTYLNKLPKRFPDRSRVFVIDPMLATGGTMVAALDLIQERGIENSQIKVISAVAAPPALQKLSEKFPGLHVYTGIIDPTVNDKGFIVPGLGDAGDRSYGT